MGRWFNANLKHKNYPMLKPLIKNTEGRGISTPPLEQEAAVVMPPATVDEVAEPARATDESAPVFARPTTYAEMSRADKNRVNLDKANAALAAKKGRP